ncbi:MAG: hypothetical protein GEU79_12915 [Acidimicrobiia bacterium]|nr:hypothetical protein [Acidimicrobiia bacterium]
MMKRHMTLLLTVVLAMALVVPVGAAELHESHVGTSCGDGQVGTWHFVNNQTEEDYTGTLTAVFDGSTVINVSASKIAGKTQHFFVEGVGEVLDSASTDLSGKLVLSDFSCSHTKKK